MRTPAPTPPQQLELFAPSDAAPSTSRRFARLRLIGSRGLLRAALTVLAIGVASASIMSGSWAAWTAQTTNAANSFGFGASYTP